jgi:hypothetical protein
MQNLICALQNVTVNFRLARVVREAQAFPRRSGPPDETKAKL